MLYYIKIRTTLSYRSKIALFFNNYEAGKLLYVVYYLIRLTGINFLAAA